MNKARVIAFYLPQFHPVKENDENWGKGFTEWTNVANAKPLWKGHHQPRIPSDLGFYDLRLQETRIAQAEMARNAGVEGFMYWHYYFGNGRLLLEKPAEWMLQEKTPDYPFCFGWANHEWSTATWVKDAKMKEKKMIAEMLYPGEEDHIMHFEYCLPFFKDKRYITVDGKPLFVIYDPLNFKNLSQFISDWQDLAKQNGFEGIYFSALWIDDEHSYDEMMTLGLDGLIRSTRRLAEKQLDGGRFIYRIKQFLAKKFNLILLKYDYSKIMNLMFYEENKLENCYPIICPGYDCTSRRGKQARIYANPTPKAFKEHVHKTLDYVENKSEQHKLIFLDSWNEWGEGNYMEPDTKWGHAYLDALRDEIVK